MASRTSLVRDLGDFQTPAGLINEVLRCLGPIGELWPRVLEPTCGAGNFIAGLLKLSPPPREIRAFELQDTYVDNARALLKAYPGNRVVIDRGDVFKVDLSSICWAESGPLLVIGNPPWVTASELGALRSANTPQKSNLKGLRGIDALTGESNFDIGESVWIKLMVELFHEQPTIALLCKTAVARNVLKFAHDRNIPVTSASIRKIDALRWFGAAVDACLFWIEMGSGKPVYEAPVYANLGATEPEGVMGIVRGRVVPNLEKYGSVAYADGKSSLVWRQGLKHDAASVMELNGDTEIMRNRLGEIADLESNYVFPLLKGTALFKGEIRAPRLFVIVPQQQLGEETRRLQQTAPKLWAYLSRHIKVFKDRKSSIYRGLPLFSVFGIGPYSFAPYKVAVSGLHKVPRFRAIGVYTSKPIMLDDTCYFIPCATPHQAAFLATLLNSPPCLRMLESMMFHDAMRPITKKLLQRIDLKAIMGSLGREELLDLATTQLRELGVEIDSAASWPVSLEHFLVERFAGPNAATQARIAF